MTKDALARVLGASFPAQGDGTDNQTDTVLEMLIEQVGRTETIAMLDQFIDENDELMTLLEDSIAMTDARLQLAEQVHKSAGSASVFRTEELMTRLKELETLLRSCRSEDLPEAKRLFGRAWTQARAELQICRARFA